MHITLIRHGQTPSNVLGLLDTASPGPGLTPLGLRQAAAIPAELADRPVDAVFVSPLVRTALTAAPLVAERDRVPVVLDGLAEIVAGDLEMRGDEGAVAAYLDTAFAWSSGELNRRMPGGESGHDFFARFDNAIRDIAASGAAHAVVFSHGAAIRAWASARIRGVHRGRVERTHFPNTASVEFKGSESAGWDLVEWRAAPMGGVSLLPSVEDDPTGAPAPE
ncbi:histidine phosphatase family protein [Microbacterium phyllosphaerae]|uniref:histidine phosphatase family protein n=1 Tax=Microbacterium phyllosphaerae TaxID=124798 RepID=UPI000EA02C4C|nr:histidine phosphatase family protein [Microbacterium phyllosphaerae]